MNDTPIQIRKPEVTRAIRELAEKTGQPITEAVADAVQDRLARLDDANEAEIERRIARAKEIVARFAALPKLGPPLTDDDLYDKDGFPK
jgi:hypothetical protein